ANRKYDRNRIRPKARTNSLPWLPLGPKLDQLLVQRGEGKPELVRVPEAHGDSACRWGRGARIQQDVRLYADLGFAGSDRRASNRRAAIGSAAVTERRRDGRNLRRI